MSGFSATLAAGVILASTLALVGMALVAIWLSGWYEERARRAQGAVRRGARLRRGFGAVRGTAQPLDGRPGGLLAATTLTQVRFGGGAWRDAGRLTTGDPFVLVLDSGEELEIDPRDAVVEGGAASIHGHPFSRDVIHRVSTGDVVWVTGIILPRREHGAGAYRRTIGRARIRAPRGRPVGISRESPAPRWLALSAAHKGSAILTVGAGVLVHAALFRRIDVAVLLRNRVACDSLLAEPRLLPVAVASALVALLVAVVGWRIRVTNARGVSSAGDRGISG